MRSAPTREYHNHHPRQPLSRPERRGVSYTRIIEPAKEKVSTLDLAEHLCGPGQLRRMGEEFVARCPLPDHEDKTPSFTVNPEKNVWFCHGCVRGGDVIELARYVWGYEKHEAAMAAADLLREFGHEIPSRPASWYKKQRRQQPIRDALEQIKIGILRRRLFRIVWPAIRAISDEAERDATADAVWQKLEYVAADHLARREQERAS